LSARQALAKDWRARGHQVRPEDICLMASTSEAYSILFKLLCDPGDEVLIPEPSYPLFEVLAALEGVKAVGYQLEYDGAWHVNFESLRAKLSARSRAIVVVSPNNPTGSYLKQGELSSIESFGLPLISDEVFWPYSLSESKTRVTSALSSARVLVFVLDGLSKRCGLPHFKLGWVTLGGPAELKEAARHRLELINDSYLSASTPVQLALPRLLEIGSGIMGQIQQRCLENLAQLERELVGSVISPLFVEGGWSATLRLPSTLSDEDWALSLFHQRGVLVQPGWFYDFGRPSHLVVSLLTPSEPFQQALQQLRLHAEAEL